MIDFRSAREKSASAFDYIQIRIASPEEIRGLGLNIQLEKRRI